MSAPTVNLQTTGSNPKTASGEQLEQTVNDGFLKIHQDSVIHVLTGVGGTENDITANTVASYQNVIDASFTFIALATNTSQMVRISLNGSTNRTIFKSNGQSPSVGDIIDGRSYVIRRYGADYRIVGTVPSDHVNDVIDEIASQIATFENQVKGDIYEAVKAQSIFAITSEIKKVLKSAASFWIKPGIAADGEISQFTSGGIWASEFSTVGSGANPTMAADGITFNAGKYLRSIETDGVNGEPYGKIMVFIDFTTPTVPSGTTILCRMSATAACEHRIDLISGLDGDKFKVRLLGPGSAGVDLPVYMGINERLRFVASIDYRSGIISLIDEDGKSHTEDFAVSDPPDLFTTTEIRIGQGVTGTIHNIYVLAEE